MFRAYSIAKRALVRDASNVLSYIYTIHYTLIHIDACLSMDGLISPIEHENFIAHSLIYLT